MKEEKTTLRSGLIYLVVIYLLSSGALAVHEFSHIFAAQYVTKDCTFTESVLRFDLLMYRRSAMTYFTCSQGVKRVSPPQVRLEWDDLTLPVLRITAAKPAGVQQITSPLTTGWFTALMGPAMEITFLAFFTDWLGRTFNGLRSVWTLFPPLLVFAFWGSWSDFSQAIPPNDPGLFVAAYILAFIAVLMLHMTLNIESYKRVLGAA